MTTPSSPEAPWPVRTVARKIASTVSALGLSRFDLKYSSGPLQHEHLMETIEHYGRTVIPRVRELLS